MKKLIPVLVLLFASAGIARARNTPSRTGAPSGIFNVKTGYGARGNGTTNDTAAIQEAIDAACRLESASASGAEVYLPAGNYRISAPLKIHCAGLHFMGAGIGNTFIKESVNAPVLTVVSSAYPGISTTRALVGAGRAIIWKRGGSGAYGLDLRESSDMDLNGLRAFTVEFATEFTKRVGRVGWIGSSNYGNDHTAFALWYDGRAIQAVMTVGGRRHQLSDAVSLKIGRVYNIALDYDGRTIRLFLNGAVAASQAATGTVDQNPAEAVILGEVPAGPMGNSYAQGMLAGVAMDNVRLSDGARYTANYAPATSKFRPDAHTLGLLTFARNPDIYTVMQSRHGDVWLPALQMPFLKYQQGFIRVNDLSVQGGTIGLWVSVTNHFYADHVGAHHDRIGLYMFNNCFRSWVNNLEVTDGTTAPVATWADVMQDTSSSPVYYNQGHWDGGKITLYEAGDGSINDAYIAISNNTRYGLYITGGTGENNIVFNNLMFDFEPTKPVVLDLIYLQHPPRITFIGGLFEDYNGTPIVAVNDVAANAITTFGTVTFVGPYFNVGSTAVPSVIFDIINRPQQPIVLINPAINGGRQGKAVALSNDMKSMSVVGGSGGLHQYGGGITLTRLPTPAAPAVRAIRTGRTGYTYYLVGRDWNGDYTMPSAGTTISNGAAHPDNQICYNGQPQQGVAYWDVLRGGTSGKVYVGSIMMDYYSTCIRDRRTAPASYAAPTRNDTADLRIGGAIKYTGTRFAKLGAPPNGTVTYCSNCTIADPCAGGGTGAIAKRLHGTWVCN